MSAADPSANVVQAPSASPVAASRLSVFCRELAERRLTATDFSGDYPALQQWSVDHPEQFWTAVWDFGGVIGERGERTLGEVGEISGTRWFPDARLNFAENLLRVRDDGDAVVFWGEDKIKERLSHAELYRRVAHLAAALRDVGVVSGDLVAAYLPNSPDTLVAMLAAASMGAVFTSASPDLDVQEVLDRFGQNQPKVLFVTDGYYYDGKTIDTMNKLAAFADGLPSVSRLVVVRYVHREHQLAGLRNGVMLDDFVAPYRYTDNIDFVPLPFAHPLYLTYSSGTAGSSKCAVHCAGAALLQHLKEQQLHGDVREGDRLFVFTTCGGALWNWLVSGLASGASLLLYDGSPFVARGSLLFDYAVAERMTHFGTSEAFIGALAKSELAPAKTHDLAALRAMLSADSLLSAESVDYVYANIKSDLQLAAIAGLTDAPCLSH